MSLDNLEKRLAKSIAGNPKAKTPISRRKMPDFSEDDGHHKWLKKILIVGSCVSAIIIGLGLFFIFSYVSTSRDVTVEIDLPENVSRGAPFSVEVSVTNNSGALINNAVITLNLPKDVVSPDFSGGRNLAMETVGDVGSGNLVKKKFSLVAVGDIGSGQKISVSMSYTIATGARFEVRESKTLKIGEPSVALEIKNPDQILSGSNFSLEINYENKSGGDFSDLTLEADYPNSFKFDSASVAPASLNNFWRLGPLRAGAKGKLLISGRLNSPAGASAEMPIRISADFGGRSYPIAEGKANLSPSASPLSLEVLVNNREDFVAKTGDTLNYSVKYRNMSGIALADTRITAALSGGMIDFSSLKTDGAFDSSSKTLSWNSSNLLAFRMLDPGAEGEVRFQIKLKSGFNLEKLNDRNFSVRLSVTMSSPSVPYYLSADKTSVNLVSETKISGLVVLSAQSFYRDMESGVSNAGDLPPKVGQPTQYSVHWIIRNFANDLNNVQVKAALAPGVRFVSGVRANLGNVPEYKEEGNQVVWTIDRLSATKGVLSEPAEAIFQIEGVPNETMVGAPEPLLGTSYLDATDNFTGISLDSIAAPITSAMVGGTPIEAIVVR